VVCGRRRRFTPLAVPAPFFPTRSGIFRCCRRHLTGLCALLRRGSRWKPRLPQTPGIAHGRDRCGRDGWMVGGWPAVFIAFLGVAHLRWPLPVSVTAGGIPRPRAHAAGRWHVARRDRWASLRRTVPLGSSVWAVGWSPRASWCAAGLLGTWSGLRSGIRGLRPVIPSGPASLREALPAPGAPPQEIAGRCRREGALAAALAPVHWRPVLRG
jgi:hypothetical protein